MQLEDFLMTGKPTYEELEERVGDIEKQVVELIKPRTIYMHGFFATSCKIKPLHRQWKRGSHYTVFFQYYANRHLIAIGDCNSGYDSI